MISLCKRLTYSISCTLLYFFSMNIHASIINSYEYTLDTSAYFGTLVNFEIDLIDGALTPSEIAFNAPLVDGVSAGLAGSIQDLSFFNFEEYPLTLGNQLAFEFSLVSSEAPSPSFFPDSFSLFLLDDVFMPLFSTSDPTGSNSLLQWDIGVMEPTVFVGNVAPTTQNTPVAVNEPSHFLLMLAAFFVVSLKRIWPLLAPLSLFMAAPVFANIETIGMTDHTAEVEITQSGLHFNRQTRTFDSVVRIKNISNRDLSGNLIFAAYDLPNGVLLTNASYILPDGTPYLSLSSISKISANSSHQIVLKFLNQTRNAFNTNFRFLALQTPLANEEQLLGADADQNGVRDDLQPLLEARYQEPEQKAAAEQVVTAIRSSLTESGSESSTFNALLIFHKAQDCLYTQFEFEEAETEADYLRDISINTKERIKAWIMLTNAAAGQSIPINSPQPCNK